MSNEHLAALDEKGNLLSHGVSRSRAHREGVWHRTVSIIVLNRYGEILVEKRSRHQDLFPGFYDTPGGHVQFGRGPDETAEEELLEELHLTPECRLIRLSEEDAVLERVIRPEKGLINLERKTVYIVEVTESEEKAILRYGSEG